MGQLPAHLVGETRTPLQEDVDALANKMADSSERVLLFVHQNYPAFYGRIEDAAGAAHYLSSAELMTAGVAHRQTLDEYLLLTSVRGVMHCNTEVRLQRNSHFIRFHIFLGNASETVCEPSGSFLFLSELYFSMIASIALHMKPKVIEVLLHVEREGSVQVLEIPGYF